MNFADFIKSKRLTARLTLREFCRLLNIDPSNWSKVERGITPPSVEESFLSKVAQTLGLSTDDAARLRDHAAISRGQIPPDLQEGEILAKMPAFFRAIRGQEYDVNDLQQMIEDVRKLHQPEN